MRQAVKDTMVAFWNELALLNLNENSKVEIKN